MSAPSYDSYGESGVRHIGDLPTHWSLVALKRVATFTYGDALAADVRGEGDIKVFGSNGPVGTHSAPNTSAPVVFVGRKGSCGALTWSDTAGFAIDTVYYVDRSCCRADLRWLYWTLHTLGLEHSSQDTGVPGLSREVAHGSPVPLPPPAEQAAIAAFLDRETGKIDALVEAQTRLIELLKEKRQAVISHAVTKGLDPAAPMKDSGVEWLGQVPAHWEVAPLKRYLELLSGYAFPSAGFSYDAADIRLLRGANIGVARIRWDDVVYWPSREALEQFSMRPGDIVLGMDRPWIADGLRIAQLSDEDAPCLLLQRVAALRPNDALRPNHLLKLLMSEAFYHHCAPDMTGVSVPHISPTQVGDFVVAIPPPAEQRDIELAVKTRTDKLAALMAEAEVTIALLQERRAALISAAVTGKIDVRGLAPEQAEAA